MSTFNIENEPLFMRSTFMRFIAHTWTLFLAMMSLGFAQRSLAQIAQLAQEQTDENTPFRQDYLRSWATQDPRESGIEGTATDHALQSPRLPPAQQEIVVAVIDTGVDISHPDLKDKIWTDPQSGIHGWNFLGNPNGTNLIYSNYEVSREYGRLSRLSQIRALTREETFYYSIIQKNHEELVFKEQQRLAAFKEGISQNGNNEDIEYLQELVARTERNLTISYNPDFNPSSIIGDDPDNLEEASYGNSDVRGGEGVHGTHVAGIIARQADAVKIMAIRAVPKGDERDKDLANAIEFAVNHGAKIINLSLGKLFSPHPERVLRAFALAESKDVLIISSAGNDGINRDEKLHFPNRVFQDPITGLTRKFQNWIVVGSSSRSKNNSLVAKSSNYGKTSVDLFAPGDQIPSAIPEGRYAILSGTSMAAPQVAGVAALIWSRFPTLSATQIKSLILENSRKYPDLEVHIPKPIKELGKLDQTGNFCELSVSCGILDLFNFIENLNLIAH